MSISARVQLWPQLYSLQTGLPQAAQCISARWAVREDYFSHASQRRGWAPLCCTKPRRKSGRETEKGRETQRGKREREESVHYTGWIFPEHRCWNTLLSWPWCRVCMPTACVVPPLLPGSLSGMRTCLWGTLSWPLIQIWASFCGAAWMDCFFVWADYCNRMYCFQLRCSLGSPMLWLCDWERWCSYGAPICFLGAQKPYIWI